MVLLTECIPCQYGDHDGHYEMIQAVPKGMIGGARCPCKGECRERPQPPVTYGPPLDTSAVEEFLSAVAPREEQAK